MSIPSSVLNTNIASIIAQRNLAGAQESLATSVERLSSGLRINRAKDDASGMAVASVIKSQISIASRAHQNINDAISMIQTGEGALQEGAAMLTRIKELATQGANDSMSKDQYYFLIQEMKQLMEELRNVAGRTTFNGNNLLGMFRFDQNGTDVLGTPTTGQNGPWQFLSGAGASDYVQIDLIPIWASRSEAVAALTAWVTVRVPLKSARLMLSTQEFPGWRILTTLRQPAGGMITSRWLQARRSPQ